MLKKTFLSWIGLSGMIVMCLATSNEALAASATPEISLKSSKDTSLVLKLTATTLKKKSVKIKVRIKNEDSDTLETRTFSAKLDKSGKTNITIDNLTDGTAYTLKAAVKKSSSSSYSDYSNEIGKNSTGSKDYAIKISTKNISTTSVKIKVSSETLKKKSVNIKFKITNEDTDKTETRVIKKTLDKSGNVNVTLDNLSADTEYSVKAAIKKTSNTSYSSFSDEKNFTTKD